MVLKTPRTVRNYQLKNPHNSSNKNTGNARLQCFACYIYTDIPPPGYIQASRVTESPFDLFSVDEPAEV